MRDPLPPRDPRRAALLASTSLIAALAASAAAAQTVLPTQGSVASGAATIHQSGSAMTIQQSSSRAVIDWGSFSIGGGDSVTFAQPNAGAATLNRVTGSTPSSIAGRLDANGQVYLINPNGIAITRSGVVSVGGGFVASTLGVSDSDFNKGDLNFAGGGASAPVSNAGTITAAPGGFVGLLGGSVANSGAISVPLGKVGLGSGERATLDLSGDGFLQVALPTDAETADGKALVDVSGVVKAAGGVIAIKAATAANAVRNAINLSGVASARSARARGGSIILSGGAGGDVNVSGALTASGRKAGGTLKLSGRNIALRGARLEARGGAGKGGAATLTASRAVKLSASGIDVSGATGGGEITVGGGSIAIGGASVLRADALTHGDGGSITIKARGATTVAAEIYARGGAFSGDGGAVETSGASLNVADAHVVTTAAQGKTGSWLLDPNDFTIAASGGDLTGAALSTELGASNVTIKSSQGATAGAGDIYVDDKVTWASANTLTLDAARNVLINAPITVQGNGGVALIVGDISQTGAGGDRGYYNFLLSGDGFVGSLSFTGAGGAFSVNTVPYTLVRTLAQLQGVTGTGNYALANSVNLGANVANSVVAAFSGTFEGLGNTISGLSITGAGSTGFIGQLGGPAFSPTNPTLRDLGLLGGTVNGGAGAGVGALVGVNYGLVTNSYATTTVQGTGSGIGGLVGENIAVPETTAGTVQNSFSVGTVSGGSNVGGLVGLNVGTVTTSYALGAVSGASNIGGLVGENDDAISNSFAMGAVRGATNVGGLVGADNEDAPGSSVTDAYSTGAVTGTTNVGGFVGLDNSGGTITAAFWDTATSGRPASPAGAGETTVQLQSGGSAALGGAFAGGTAGLYPYLTSFFPNGVEAISGFAYKDRAASAPLVSGALGAATVSADVGGVTLFPDDAGANGYYYVFAPAGVIPSGANVVAFTRANATVGATNAASYVVATGADNTDVNVFGLTLTEMTTDPTYSQLAAGLANGLGTDPLGQAAVGGVGFINIISLGANFLIDQPISTPAELSVNGATTLAANVTATGGVNFYNNVLLGATVTVDSGANTTTFAGSIDGSATPGAGLTVTGPVILNSNVTTNNGALAFNGPVLLYNSLTITSGTAATRFGSTIDSGTLYGGSEDNNLTVTAGALSFGGAIGGTDALGAVSLTSTSAGMTLPSITSTTLFAETGAGTNLTIGAGATLTTTADGNAVTLVAGLGFINDSGPGAIVTNPDPGYWLIYSASPAADTFGGLNSNNHAIWNTPYPGAAPQTPGDYYEFAYQPTVTFTSINDSKTYGQNVTARVATDFVVSGVQAGVPGVYLADTPALAYSGSPSVTSAGSATTATVGGGAYSINVAQGTLAAGDGYALAFASPGLLTVGAEAITVTAAANAKTYDTTTTAAALPTVTTGALYDAATLAETYATANAGTGIQLNPTIAFTNPAAASNYIVTLAAAKIGVINPEPITVTSSANTKTYDSTTSAAALPTVTAGVLYDAASFSETYANPNAGAGIQLNPTIAFATPGAASNYAVTLTPTLNGVINPEPITLTATPSTKYYDGTTSSTALPTLTSGTLFDPAKLSESFASANPAVGVSLIPAIAFVNPGVTGDYAITLVPTGTTPPNTGVILPPFPPMALINTSPSVFTNPEPAFQIPGAGAACGAELQLPDPSSFSDPVQAVQAISDAVSQYMDRCRDASQEDIANLLDRYADALEVIVQKLPPKLRAQLIHLPAIVRAAAVRARAAPTRVAAVRVLRQAVAQVQREITLVRAEDPDSARIRNAVGSAVAGVLDKAAVSLARAEGI